MRNIMLKLLILFWKQMEQMFVSAQAKVIFPVSHHKLRPDLEVFLTNQEMSVHFDSLPSFLTTFYKNGELYILIAAKGYERYGSGVIVVARDDHKRSWTDKMPINDGVDTPHEVQVVPDGIFDFPAFVIPGGKYATKSPGVLKLYDGTNMYNLKKYSLVTEEIGVHYCNPIWINGKDFLAAKRARKNYGLKYFKHISDFNWEEMTNFSNYKTIKKRQFCNMVLYKNIWESFDAIFAFEQEEGLILLWTEDETGAPGNWENPDQLKSEKLDSITNILNIQLYDLNLDGEMDVIVCVEPFDGEIRVYEKPFNNTDFRNISNYKMHTLLTNFRGKRDFPAPRIVKVFTPLVKYEGKPWITISGEVLGIVYYLVPLNNDPENWEYAKFTIPTGSEQVSGIEVADYDNDGLNDFFVSFPAYRSINIYLMRSKDLVPPPPTTTTQGTPPPTQVSSAPKGSLDCLDVVLLSTICIIFSKSCWTSFSILYSIL